LRAVQVFQIYDL